MLDKPGNALVELSHHAGRVVAYWWGQRALCQPADRWDRL